MTLTVDVDQLTSQWPEVLAKVEAGHDVTLSRGATPVARVTKVAKPTKTSADAIDAIFEARKGIPPTTIDEILAWRDEGRR